MQETWTQWNPTEYDIHEEYQLEHCSNDYYGFNAILNSIKNSKKKIRFSFYSRFMYRITDRCSAVLPPNFNYEKGLWFLKSTNSLFMQWVAQESGGIFDFPNQHEIHYSIISSNFVVDAICHCEPGCFIEDVFLEG